MSDEQRKEDEVEAHTAKHGTARWGANDEPAADDEVEGHVTRHA